MKRNLLLLSPLFVLYFAVPLALGPAGPQDDEAVYLRVAERITHGRYADSSLSDADYIWYPPALPALLAPLVGADLPLDVIRLVGPICLFGAVLAFFGLLRLFATPRMALLGAYAFGLYPPFFVLIRRTFSEPLALLLLTVSMLLIARAVRLGSKRDAVGAGIGLGLLALTRAAFGWIVVLALAGSVLWWLLRPASRRIAAAAATAGVVALVCTVPWLVYTYERSDRPFYWGNAGGLSLYWMASPFPGELGDWHAYDDVPERHERFFRALTRIHDPVERDVALQERAITWLRERPTGFLGNLPPNGSRLLFGFPYRDDGLGVIALVYALPNALMLLALGASLVRIARTRRGVPAEGVLFLTFAAITLAFHLALSADPRMFVPVVPVALWTIAWAYCDRVGEGRAATVGSSGSTRPSAIVS